MGRKLTLKLGGRKLPNKDLFSKSDPFLIVFNVTSSGAFKFVKRTEVKKVGVKVYFVCLLNTNYLEQS